MHADSARSRLRHWLEEIGVGKERLSQYGFHSLRSGGATDAARNGVEERYIKEAGNWKSDAVRGYMRMSEGERTITSSAMGSAKKKQKIAQ